MAIAKVILNGETLMDVTSNTVTSETLKTGYTAIGSDGETVEGSYVVRLQNKEVIHSQTDEIVGPGEDTFVFFNKKETCTTHSNNSVDYVVSLKLKQFDISKIYYIVGNIEIVDANNNLLDTIYINNKINNVIGVDQYANIESNNYLENVYFDWDAANTNYSNLYYTYKAGTYGLIIKVGVVENSNEYEGLSTVSLKLNGDEIIEKAMVRRIPIYASGSTYQLPINNQGLTTSYTYTSSDIVNWCNSFSSISYGQFAERPFFGNFVFNNLSSIGSYGFGWNYECGKTPMGSGTINLPIISSIGIGVFVNNPWIRELTASQCISIGQSAFKMCMSLYSIELPLCQTIGSYAFYYCSLITLNLPVCTRIEHYAFNTCSSLTTVNLPSCSYIGGYGFGNARRLSSISIPLCQSISSSTFINCSGLTSIFGPECITIGTAGFSNCYSLISASFPKCTSIGNNAFYNCSKLIFIDLTSCINIGLSAFVGCISLSTITLPNCTSLGSYAFSNCYSLAQVSLPKVSQIDANTFQSCYNLISLYLLGSSLCDLKTTNAFYSTPISGYSTSAGRWGSVFVPSSLYTDYCTASNWSLISSRIVSV